MPLRPCLFALLLALCAASPCLCATTLWQIGTADNNYRELAIPGQHPRYNETFPADVTFRIGASEPAQSWPFIQPGPSDAWAGGRPHPFVIEWDQADPVQGACRLVIDFVNTHWGGAPELEVRLNDARVYRFSLPAGAPDASLTDPFAGRETVVPLLFPATAVLPGPNRLTITVSAGSWVLYDAVWLESGLDLPTGPVLGTVRAECQPLFKVVDGELRQAIAIQALNTGLEGTATLSTPDGRCPDLTTGLIQGANSLYLMVPPFTRAERFPITITAGDQHQTVECQARPDRRWTVYVAASTHTDIGYTDWQERVYDLHNANTRAAVRDCDEDAGYKWNLEVAFQAELAATDPELYARLMQCARDGRIGIQGLYLNMLTGICSPEELVEAIAIPQRLARDNGFPVLSAKLSDVPSAIGTLPTLLAAAGVRYFAEGINSYRGPTLASGDRRLSQAPFWWEGPDGSRVLTMLCGGYAQASGLGMVQDVPNIAQKLPGWLRGCDRDDYLGDCALVYGAFSDNQPVIARLSDAIREWNATWDYPRITLARTDEFFQEVERTVGDRLPVYRGDFGGYWEDGAASSAAETAAVRWARTRINSAQIRSALTAARGESPAPDSAAFDRAWRDVLLYDEHTWGAWCSTTQPQAETTLHQWAVKAGFAESAARAADTLALAAPSTASADLPLIVSVPNDLSWARDIVAFAATAPLPACRVTDLDSGEVVPSQPTPGGVIFLARDVPGLGRIGFRVEPAEASDTPPVLRPGASSWQWQSDAWEIELSPETGAIVGLLDRASGRQWVDTARGEGLNQLIYASGGEGTGLVMNGSAPAQPTLTTPTGWRVELVEHGPVRGVLKLESASPADPNLTAWLVVGADGRLDLHNVVHKAPTTALEGVYFAFPFRLDQPGRARAFMELPYGYVEAEREQLPGACRDWYSTNSFAAISDDRATALLATPHAPLVTVGDIFRGYWRAHLTPGNGALYAYVMNNYWNTNYKASQGGDTVFSFSLQPREGAFDPAAATRFGWAALDAMPDPRNPSPERLWGHGDTSALPSESASSCALPLVQTTPEVLVGGARPEPGGLLLRLYNPGDQDAITPVSLPDRSIAAAWATDVIGREPRELPVTEGLTAVGVPARGLATVRLRLEP